MTFHALTEYLKYRWQAKGRHGTHSPFVYDFIENGLQRRIGRQQRARFRHPAIPGLTALDERTLRCRILRYFGIQTVAFGTDESGGGRYLWRTREHSGRLFLEEDTDATAALRQYVKGNREELPFEIDLLELYPYDVGYMLKLWENNQRLVSRNTVVLIHRIHVATPYTRTWDHIRGSSKVRLSMDLYDMGLLFFREEFLEKQHFVVKH